MIGDDAQERYTSNVMRHQYRPLSDAEKGQMQSLKDKGLELFQLIDNLGRSREISLALAKTEEAVMWATKHLTR
jgi:tRNA(Ile)-lysidine synthase TilS/MesJ